MYSKHYSPKNAAIYKYKYSIISRDMAILTSFKPFNNRRVVTVSRKKFLLFSFCMVFLFTIFSLFPSCIHISVSVLTEKRRREGHNKDEDWKMMLYVFLGWENRSFVLLFSSLLLFWFLVNFFTLFVFIFFFALVLFWIEAKSFTLVFQFC